MSKFHFRLKHNNTKESSVILQSFNWNVNYDINGLRIGYHTRFFEKELMGNPKSDYDIWYRKFIREKCAKVLTLFKNRGFDLIPLEFNIQSAGAGLILEVEATTAFSKMIRDNTLSDKESKWPNKFRQYRFVPAVEYLEATRQRTRMVHQMEKVFKQVDVYIEITWSNNWVTNMTGNPICVVPCGFLDDGRPVTITFVGKWFDEQKLLSVAHYFQNNTGFHKKYPNY